MLEHLFSSFECFSMSTPPAVTGGEKKGERSRLSKEMEMCPLKPLGQKVLSGGTDGALTTVDAYIHEEE